MNEKLSFKELLTILTISLLATPVVYFIVTIPPGWWLR